MFSAFGALNGVILAGPRVYYSMAQDGLLFKWVADVHPTYRTPGRAIAAAGGVGRRARDHRDLPRALHARDLHGVDLLRRCSRSASCSCGAAPATRPRWRMPGVPLVPVAFALASFAIALNQIRVDPLNSVIGLLMVLIGLPVYWLWAPRMGTEGKPRPTALT